MVNIKSYKDGDRLILAIENCTGDLAVKVNRFLAEIVGVEAAEPKIVPALEPPEVIDEITPDLTKAIAAKPGDFKEPLSEKEILHYTLKEGAYSGKSVEQVFEEFGVDAAIKIACEVKIIPEDIRESVVKLCKRDIMKDLNRRNAEMDSIEEIKAFFNQYKFLVRDGIEQILAMAGYVTLDEFFILADEQMQRDAYESIIQGLAERVS